MIGKSVTMPCRTKLTTPVDWYYLPSPNARGEILCSAGNILNGHRRRFALDRSVPGDFGLIIVNVTGEDEGLYVCKEDAGHGTKHQVTLNVYGKMLWSFYMHAVVPICSVDKANVSMPMLFLKKIGRSASATVK